MLHDHLWGLAAGYEVITLPTSWMYADDDRVDVAVLRLDVDRRKFQVQGVALGAAATEEIVHDNAIGIGNEVLAIGLFGLHHGRKRNLPIVRHGIISCMPHEPLFDLSYGAYTAYLVELYSLKGLSGAPVYVFVPQRALFTRSRNEQFREQVRRNHPAGYVFLLGLIRGHFNETTEFGDVHQGIATVTPITEAIKIIQADQAESAGS